VELEKAFSFVIPPFFKVKVKDYGRPPLAENKLTEAVLRSTPKDGYPLAYMPLSPKAFVNRLEATRPPVLPCHAILFRWLFAYTSPFKLQIIAVHRYFR
jgi:hypothetical protein